MGPELARLAREAVGLDLLAEATHEAAGENPVCGDRIAIAAGVEAGRIERLCFRATACPACVAVASCASIAFEGAPFPLQAASARLRREVEVRGGLTRFEEHAFELVTEVLARLGPK